MELVIFVFYFRKMHEDPKERTPPYLLGNQVHQGRVLQT